MSWHMVLECDFCWDTFGEVGNSTRQYARLYELRAAARKYGWRWTQAKGDRCPRHLSVALEGQKP